MSTEKGRPSISKGRPEKRRLVRRIPVIGWREWVAFPELGIDRIKAKVDTGARSSALHALDIRQIDVDGEPWVRFKVQTIQRDPHSPTIESEALMVDERWVRSSSGVRTLRPVIETAIRIGEVEWPIEITLVRRDLMGFRLLLGRQAIRNRFLVHTGRSFIAGRTGMKRSTKSSPIESPKKGN